MVKMLRWAFPNGLGTRATLALIVVSVTMVALIEAGATDKMADLTLLVLGWYFIQRMANGGNGGGK